MCDIRSFREVRLPGPPQSATQHEEGSSWKASLRLSSGERNVFIFVLGSVARYSVKYDNRAEDTDGENEMKKFQQGERGAHARKSFWKWIDPID